MSDKPRRGGRRPLLTIKTKREGNGRWIAEVLELPDVVVCADTEIEARAEAVDLALHILTARIRQAGEA
jgi:predicted RNase H-like HicB family nuclease